MMEEGKFLNLVTMMESWKRQGDKYLEKKHYPLIILRDKE